MWIVEPEFHEESSGLQPSLEIINVDSILRAAHLIPVFGQEFMEKAVDPNDTLEKYAEFYVNKFADHHANEVAF